ncbi:MAG: pitrilysin family protein [Bacteroidota bacterium]
MIRFLVAFCAMQLLFTAVIHTAEKNKIFPYEINKEVLNNGLTVLSVPYESPGIIAYYTIVRTGSRNEVEDGKSGFAHFFEHMMFRGTKKYSSQAYNDIVKKLGSDANAFTSDDWTAYHLVASSSALETIMDIESDRFQHLEYSVDDFKTEAGAILGEYNKSYSNPFLSMFEKLQEAAFTTHTYKHTTIGFLKDIQDMPNQYDYSLQFFDRYYRPENCIVVVVGDFDQKKLMELTNKYYGTWERGNYVAEIPKEPEQNEEKIVTMTWKTPTLPMLMLGYHSPAFSDKNIDMPALDVFSQIYFSESSTLFQKLVIEKQLIEFIEGGAENHRDPYLFTIITRIKDKENIEKVRDEIYQTLSEAAITPVSAERLANVKSHMRYAFAMSMNNADAVAVTLGNYLQLTGDAESINRVYDLYEKVTPEDLVNVAKKYFSKENRTVLTLTQEETK